MARCPICNDTGKRPLFTHLVDCEACSQDTALQLRHAEIPPGNLGPLDGDTWRIRFAFMYDDQIIGCDLIEAKVRDGRVTLLTPIQVPPNADEVSIDIGDGRGWWNIFIHPGKDPIFPAGYMFGL